MQCGNPESWKIRIDVIFFTMVSKGVATTDLVLFPIADLLPLFPGLPLFRTFGLLQPLAVSSIILVVLLAVALCTYSR